VWLIESGHSITLYICREREYLYFGFSTPTINMSSSIDSSSASSFQDKAKGCHSTILWWQERRCFLWVHWRNFFCHMAPQWHMMVLTAGFIYSKWWHADRKGCIDNCQWSSNLGLLEGHGEYSSWKNNDHNNEAKEEQRWWSSMILSQHVCIFLLLNMCIDDAYLTIWLENHNMANKIMTKKQQSIVSYEFLYWLPVHQ